MTIINEKEKTIKIIRKGEIPDQFKTRRIITCNICNTEFEIIDEEYDRVYWAAGQIIIRPECPVCFHGVDVIVKG